MSTKEEWITRAAEMEAQRDRLLKSLKDCRLMMYAWKAARKNLGLADDHGELNNTIAELEAVLATHN